MGFVTYDLKQQESGREPIISRHVEEVSLPSPPAYWDIGTFEHPSGKKVYAVRFDSAVSSQSGTKEASQEEPAVTTLESKLVEIPANAENVQYFEDEIPAEYRATSGKN